jgi:small GTP-binding protein
MNRSRASTTNKNISFERVVYRFKVILLGNVFVGKTSIIHQFLSNNYQSDYACTVAVDYKLKSLLIDDETSVDLQIWDTCGQEIYRTITRQYYRDTQGMFKYF